MLIEKPIRALYFDFGKTVIDYHLDFFFNRLQGKFGLPRHHFWPAFSGDLLFKFETGELSSREFIAAFRTATAQMFLKLAETDGKKVRFAEFTDAEFVAAWNSVFDLQWDWRERLAVMRKIRGAGYKVFILSNTNPIHMNYFHGHGHGHAYSPFREVFGSVDRFIASCDADVQARKTFFTGENRTDAEKIFWRALEIGRVGPQESIFVDDIQNFTDTFKRMGGQGIVCRGSWTNVEHEMYKLGVRWNE